MRNILTKHKKKNPLGKYERNKVHVISKSIGSKYIMLLLHGEYTAVFGKYASTNTHTKKKNKNYFMEFCLLYIT